MEFSLLHPIKKQPYNFIVNIQVPGAGGDQENHNTQTHQHEWEMSPYLALTINAFQDGISLPMGDTWYLEDVTAEDEAFEEDVAQGETVDCNAIFILRNDSPVEVVVEQPLDDLRAGILCGVE